MAEIAGAMGMAQPRAPQSMAAKRLSGSWVVAEGASGGIDAVRIVHAVILLVDAVQ
jgi:hypothetical protein